MNRVIITGRLATDVQLRYTQGDNSVAYAKFNVAVNRKKNKDGSQEADFISCQAWGKTAELIEKHVNKGDKIGIEGSIRTGSYEKNGQKVYTTDILVENIEFMTPKSEQKKEEPKQEQIPIPSGFAEITDDDIPF